MRHLTVWCRQVRSRLGNRPRLLPATPYREGELPSLSSARLLYCRTAFKGFCGVKLKQRCTTALHGLYHKAMQLSVVSTAAAQLKPLSQGPHSMSPMQILVRLILLLSLRRAASCCLAPPCWRWRLLRCWRYVTMGSTPQRRWLMWPLRRRTSCHRFAQALGAQQVSCDVILPCTVSL